MGRTILVVFEAIGPLGQVPNNSRQVKVVAKRGEDEDDIADKKFNSELVEGSKSEGGVETKIIFGVPHTDVVALARYQSTGLQAVPEGSGGSDVPYTPTVVS